MAAAANTEARRLLKFLTVVGVTYDDADCNADRCPRWALYAVTVKDGNAKRRRGQRDIGNLLLFEIPSMLKLLILFIPYITIVGLNAVDNLSLLIFYHLNLIIFYTI